jgi:hypothetical protein
MRANLPTARPDADIQLDLNDSLWQAKYQLITQVYGFDPQSWEARSTPRQEAFWKLDEPVDIRRIEKLKDAPP